MIYASYAITPDPAYAFPAAIAAQLWQRLGVQSIVWLMGDYGTWRNHAALSVVRDALEECPGIQFIHVLQNPERHHPASEAVLVRQLVGNLVYAAAEPDDFCLLSDADLWLFSKDYLYEGLSRGQTGDCAVSWYANAYRPILNGAPVWYPACHVGMPVSLWRQVNDVAEGLEDGLADLCARVWPGEPKYEPFGNEQYLARRLRELNVRVETIHRLELGDCSPVGRLDRANWQGGDVDYAMTLIDAHVPRDLWDPGMWRLALNVLRVRYGAELANWANAYRDRFVHALAHEEAP